MATLIEPPAQVQTGMTFVLLHTLCFDEVAASKKSVSTRNGTLVAGPDRRNANALAAPHLWRLWQQDVQAAIDRPGAWPCPAKVQDYFLRTKHLTSPPKEGMDLKVYGSNPPLNAEPLVFDETVMPEEGQMIDLLSLEPEAAPASSAKKLANPPRFATSFSGMESFLQCPRKWAAEKYFKTVPFEESEAVKWGNRVHQTAEHYLLNAQCAGSLPIEAECLPLVQKYCDAFVRSGAQFFVEREMCCKKDLSTCGWKDWNTVWFRGKADVVTIKDRKLCVYDWKTGKYKAGQAEIRSDVPNQLEVMVALADLHYPDQFDEATGGFIYVKEEDPKKALVKLPAPITKADIPRIWEKIFAVTNRMEAAWQSEVFRMQSNGLCKNYCGDLSCAHNGRR